MKFANLNRYLALAGGFLVFGAVAYYFSNIVAYVLIAWVLSMLGQPLIRLLLKYLRVGNFRASHSLSAAIVLLLFFVIAFGLLRIFVPLLVEQTAQFANIDFNSVTQALNPPIQKMNEWLARHGLAGQIVSPSDQLRDILFGHFNPSGISDFFSSLVSFTAHFLIDILSISFITFFFLKEQGLFVNFLVAVVPSQYEVQIRHAVDDASELLSRYFGGILLQMTAIVIILTAGLTILGIPNALLIAIFTALINVIPYVGPLIGLTFGIFVTITSNFELDFYSQLLPLIFEVVGVFFIMKMIDDFVLQPFIFSKSVMAHPLEIFIVILMGAKINGILGMALAIPTYTVIRLIARVFLSEFKIVQKLTGSMEGLDDGREEEEQNHQSDSFSS
jgi:predicted PurR-regulated permease PerM